VTKFGQLKFLPVLKGNLSLIFIPGPLIQVLILFDDLPLRKGAELDLCERDGALV
jgi:hypothetical protein